MKAAIVGAGAAGCFCAVNLKMARPDIDVHLYESGEHPLAKVAVTGGGRCNVTNSFRGIKHIADAYPRGEQLMKKAFKTFDRVDTVKWFEENGVKLTLQSDQCYFPVSQDAMEVVFMFRRLMRELGIHLHLKHKVERIEALEDGGYSISFVQPASSNGLPQKDYEPITADKVVVTAGGSQKKDFLSFLDGLDLEILPPLPSLFTFNLPGDPLNAMMGAVVENTRTSLCGTSFKAEGPLLVTHWGISGPAVLKLSSYGARYLAEKGYEADCAINWLGSMNEQQANEMITGMAAANPKKSVNSTRPEFLTARLWEYLTAKAGMRSDLRWAEAGAKGMRKLAGLLINDVHHIKGQSRFKEEFVTCGGVALSNVSTATLECRNHPGLYFAGEVLDIDAITGGFNLQAAWTTGYVVSKSISES